MRVTTGWRPVSLTARTAMRRRTWSRAATSHSIPPFNYPAKASLMRYTRGHQDISCQGCHESIHGLYPVGAGDRQHELCPGGGAERGRLARPAEVRYLPHG